MRVQFVVGIILLMAGLVLCCPGRCFAQKKMDRGGWGNPLENIAKDPDQVFNMLAKGRSFFLINDTRMIRDQLTQYAQEKGISNGQITREQFQGFSKEIKAKLEAGTLKMAFSFPFPKKDQEGSKEAGPKMIAGDATEAMKKFAEEEFKRRDVNGDGFLNKDEMPDALKSELSKWDKNNDNLISLEEFRDYFIARLLGLRGDNDKAPANPLVIIIDDDELDKRPTVIRAGKLPKELPPWFGQLDSDGDGQVALWEWRKGNKKLEEFYEWDRNDDGFITAEEVLHKLSQNRALTQKNGNGAAAQPVVISPRPPEASRGPDDKKGRGKFKRLE
jgi:Ca2+-binding EF-hand superfamily protein